MKIIFLVPHYYKPTLFRENSSRSFGKKKRYNAIKESIRTLETGFLTPALKLNFERMLANVYPNKYEIEIIFCTLKKNNFVSKLRNANVSLKQEVLDVEPPDIGLACQEIFKDKIDKYDYYCFVEDDLAIRDPLFFEKLKWFNRSTSEKELLQPNRYELGKHRKIYIDGDLPEKITAAYQDIEDNSTIYLSAFGAEFAFSRQTNPHSGCYFLTNEQLKVWSKKSYFADYDGSFVGKLESAATLGIMKTFKIYKSERLDFFEIEHLDLRFFSWVKKKKHGFVVLPKEENKLIRQLKKRHLTQVVKRALRRSN